MNVSGKFTVTVVIIDYGKKNKIFKKWMSIKLLILFFLDTNFVSHRELLKVTPKVDHLHSKKWADIQ